jgi:uncharacterized integral membrane protein
MVWDGGLCEHCRTLAATWGLFLLLAVAGALIVWLHRYGIAAFLVAWLIASYDQLGYLTADTPDPLIVHAFSVIAVGLLIPLATWLFRMRRHRTQHRPSV